MFISIAIILQKISQSQTISGPYYPDLILLAYLFYGNTNPQFLALRKFLNNKKSRDLRDFNENFYR